MISGKVSSLIRRMTVAFLLVLAAILLRWGPLQNMGTKLAYVTFFPMVALASLYGGRMPGIFATLLSSIYVYVWQSHSNPEFDNTVGIEGLVLFAFSGFLVSSMSEKLSAARVQTDDALKLVEIERMRADEIRKAQQKIEESDTRYQNIIKTTAEGFWLVDDVGSLLEVNDAYIEMSGFSRKELVQMNIADLEAAESLIEVQTHLKKVAQAGLDRFETMHRRKDGSIWPVEISVNFVHNNEDLYYVFLRDITERKRIEGKVIDYSKMLEKSMEGTLLAISHMVEQRDPYTAGHERRVGVIASDIAHEMGWVANKCKELEWIGLVHDIGKIGVPAEILSKPGKLTHAEYELVKEHAQRGYEILKDVPFPMPIADIIHQHHERMDGSGYPRQLKGDEIMPEARILIVADVVESIASHRPYRPALGLSFAVQEITKHRGVLYDAEVVDTFLRLVNEKRYQLPA